MKENITQLHGDCREVLKTLPDESVNCCVTSPPYYGLRDYGVDGQIGIEESPGEFIKQIVAVFREVKIVLRSDGTLWLNLGDSYVRDMTSGASGTNGYHEYQGKKPAPKVNTKEKNIFKPKDLYGIPWRVAFALQDDGWYLRQDIIWHKPNPMPESVRDRCTKSHEYIFLLSKSPKYYYNFEAIKEPVNGNAHRRCKDTGVGFGHGVDKDKRKRGRIKAPQGWDTTKGNGGHVSFHKEGRAPGVHPKSAPAGSGIKANESFSAAIVDLVTERNKRSVWTIATQGYSAAHFATFPEKLIEPCIMAGCPEGGTVLDPFGGSGTTARVAIKNRRKAILIELNEEYIGLQNARTSNVQINLFGSSI